MKKNIFNKTLPVVASVLSNQLGVRVNVCGKDAFTTVNEITVPDYEVEEHSDIMLTKGFLAHEAAHIRYKSFDYDLINVSPFKARLINALEDVRIERLMCADFIGTKPWINHIPKVLLENGMMGTLNQDSNDGDIFTFTILYIARNRFNGQTVLSDTANQMEKLLEQRFGKVVLVKTKGILSSIPKMETIFDTVEIADKLISMLKDESQDGQYTIIQAINNAINATDNELQQTDAGTMITEILKDKISDKNVCSGWDAKTVQFNDVFNKEAITKQGQDRIARVKKYSNSLSAKLQNLIQSKRLVRTKEDVSGTLNQKKLYRSAIGDRHIFIEQRRQKKQGATFHFCLDYSGSMDSEYTTGLKRYHLLRDSILALTTSLNGMSKVTTSCSVFPFYGKDKVGILKKENDSLVTFANHLFTIHPNGGTPIGYGYFHGMRELISNREKNKIMFLFTDGEFSREHEQLLIEAYQDSKKYGVKTFAIGITEYADMSKLNNIFSNENCILIKDLSTMKDKLFNLCRNVIC
ncbi:TPA: vWA domain-containing protein [Photobacterium damselae]